MQQRSYADVVAQHAPALLRLAVMLTGGTNAAEDLLQSTFLRGLRHGERIAAMDAPAAYLRRIMINERLASGRRMSRRPRTVAIGDAWPATEAERPQGLEERDEVWRWLATLKRDQRAVLVLRFYEDLPDSEIAELLGCAEATVRSHALRGLTALRAHLSNSTVEMDEK